MGSLSLVGYIGHKNPEVPNVMKDERKKKIEESYKKVVKANHQALFRLAKEDNHAR